MQHFMGGNSFFNGMLHYVLLSSTKKAFSNRNGRNGSKNMTGEWLNTFHTKITGFRPFLMAQITDLLSYAVLKQYPVDGGQGR